MIESLTILDGKIAQNYLMMSLFAQTRSEPQRSPAAICELICRLREYSPFHNASIFDSDRFDSGRSSVFPWKH